MPTPTESTADTAAIGDEGARGGDGTLPVAATRGGGHVAVLTAGKRLLRSGPGNKHNFTRKLDSRVVRSHHILSRCVSRILLIKFSLSHVRL